MPGVTVAEEFQLLQKDVEQLQSDQELLHHKYSDLNNGYADLKAQRDSLLAQVDHRFVRNLTERFEEVQSEKDVLGQRYHQQSLQLQALHSTHVLKKNYEKLQAERDFLLERNREQHLQLSVSRKTKVEQPDTHNQKARSHQVFPFFKLCAELRAMILEECLIVGKVFPRARPKDDQRLEEMEHHKKPISQLLYVSRQMRAEAAPIFFHGNIFVISHGVDSWPWQPFFGVSTPRLKSLYDLATEYVRHLCICFDVRDYPGSDRDALERALDYDDTLSDQAHFMEEMDFICPSWKRRHEHYRSFSLETLEADFANHFCTRGCCKLQNEAIDDFLFKWRTASFPKRVVVKNLACAGDAHSKYGRLLGITDELDYLHRLIVEGYSKPSAEFILEDAGWDHVCGCGDHDEEMLQIEVAKQWFADNWTD